MAGRIEDYALIGDLHTAALVRRDGSIDWLCLPRFDSPACFAALLGDEGHGRWIITPDGDVVRTSRRYVEGTLVLETEFTTADGTARLIDLMPVRSEHVDVVRIVEGVSGRVGMTSRLRAAFGYGDLIPWVERTGDGISAVGGPDALHLQGNVGVDEITPDVISRFTVSPGQRVAFVLTWHQSHEPPPTPVDAFDARDSTLEWWQDWCGRCTYDGEWREPVLRSLITLKAMTYAPTGGVVAAPTTSLPEALGGVRNWDYRYCWVRDATFTLQALLAGGFVDEAASWRDWLLRAVAGAPSQMQIMYGPAGERLLPEVELDWLPGYEGSAPVRIGNAASDQFQLDVHGELMDMLHEARRYGVEPDPRAWDLQIALMEFLESNWHSPDEGIWEMRSGRQQFTHSKVMAWVASDRAVKSIERFGLDGDVERWRALRDEIHHEVCRYGWNEERGAFTQAYGSTALDASLLMMPLVSFLPADDPRIVSTIEAIRDDLCRDGFVLRYDSGVTDDGMPAGEGAFLPCTFWLADALAEIGREDDARDVFERLIGLTNDVGLLSEEYDHERKRLVGNFPQALSHIALVDTAQRLSHHAAAEHRRGS